MSPVTIEVQDARIQFIPGEGLVLIVIYKGKVHLVEEIISLEVRN